MGDAGEETKKAMRIAAMDGDGASARVPVAAAEQQRQAPLLLPAAGGGSGVVQGCGAGDDDAADDEKVERFYALLANIRALRGLCSAGESGSAAAGRGRKRAREAEAPWRPAFRMEDFEEEVSQSQATADARSGAGVVARPPAAARARAAAVDREELEDSEVAEASGKKLGRRVAAQG